MQVSIGKKNVLNIWDHCRFRINKIEKCELKKKYFKHEVHEAHKDIFSGIVDAKRF
jgi:hypothetical protein